ncbi:hypothetical protein GCM10022243_53570 [Saccharothrix violaceirubra]|uniref:SnoaL-like protein n=1 Tax=Saccharothrix violaceirubra TaxID=413306 RepID=A0A7W7T191_9PSEU|nr:nuclear transport factor 2 family protein [Saccharothrix violaceirubra]MBB4963420.1 hypothetical protein [Saccharothrix violaceirubra]
MGGFDRPVDVGAVRGLVRDWFAALDRHDDADVLLALLAPIGLVLHLPGATVRDREGLRAWHADRVSTYFDETHRAHDVRVRVVSPRHAEVLVRVDWRASVWVPPAAGSTRVGGESTQRWSVVPWHDGKPRLRTCVLGGPTPVPGSVAPRAARPTGLGAAA